MPTIAEICTRWKSAERPLFKGHLIDANCQVCAQGDVLRVAGYSDKQLREITQSFADIEVAKILGISRAHSILLRQVNDRADGCPQDVLESPEKIIGDNAQTILIFWRFIDSMTSKQWDAARDATWDAAASWTTAWNVAWAIAGAAAEVAAEASAGASAGAAVGAVMEIQGESVFITDGRPFYFLPFFGFANPQAVRDWKP